MEENLLSWKKMAILYIFGIFGKTVSYLRQLLVLGRNRPQKFEELVSNIRSNVERESIYFVKHCNYLKLKQHILTTDSYEELCRWFTVGKLAAVDVQQAQGLVSLQILTERGDAFGMIQRRKAQVKSCNCVKCAT